MAGRVQFKVTLSEAGESVAKFVIAGGTEEKNKLMICTFNYNYTFNLLSLVYTVQGLKDDKHNTKEKILNDHNFVSLVK